MGSRLSDYGEGMDYMMASESVSLKQLGFSDFRDVLPGEAVIIRKGAAPVFYQIQEQKRYAPDIFEFCYFARPDSVIDGISVNQSREIMGYRLANKIMRTLTPEEIKEIDAVIPIPETSNTSAPCVAARLKRKFYQGFVKNQANPATGRQRKLSIMDEKFVGKNVLLIDDSTVRGTTSRQIVEAARDAGAKVRHPSGLRYPRDFYPMRHTPSAERVPWNLSDSGDIHAHIYGIDLASPTELIAHEDGHDRAISEIAKHIGADRVIFQDLEDLKAACSEVQVPPTGAPPEDRDFEVGVFCGTYVTPVDARYSKHLEEVRGETRKMKVLEKARETVANGSTDPEELEMAAHGVKVTENGKVVPAASDGLEARRHATSNGGEKRRRLTKERGIFRKTEWISACIILGISRADVWEGYTSISIFTIFLELVHFHIGGCIL
ncbi:MAG: hypothetical protein Q9166_005208 [cf. Caloplaca sp. 2 TL-2023]